MVATLQFVRRLRDMASTAAYKAKVDLDLNCGVPYRMDIFLWKNLQELRPLGTLSSMPVKYSLDPSRRILGRTCKMFLALRYISIFSTNARWFLRHWGSLSIPVSQNRLGRLEFI